MAPGKWRNLINTLFQPPCPNLEAILYLVKILSSLNLAIVNKA